MAKKKVTKKADVEEFYDAHISVVANCPKCDFQMERTDVRTRIISCSNEMCNFYGVKFEQPSIKIKRI